MNNSATNDEKRQLYFVTYFVFRTLNATVSLVFRRFNCMHTNRYTVPFYIILNIFRFIFDIPSVLPAVQNMEFCRRKKNWHKIRNSNHPRYLN